MALAYCRTVPRRQEVAWHLFVLFRARPCGPLTLPSRPFYRSFWDDAEVALGYLARYIRGGWRSATGGFSSLTHARHGDVRLPQE